MCPYNQYVLYVLILAIVKINFGFFKSFYDNLYWSEILLKNQLIPKLQYMCINNCKSNVIMMICLSVPSFEISLGAATDLFIYPMKSSDSLRNSVDLSWFLAPYNLRMISQMALTLIESETVISNSVTFSNKNVCFYNPLAITCLMYMSSHLFEHLLSFTIWSCN